MSLPRLLVIAKAPEPGRSKTRLCPPCTPEQAAELAEAALADTLDVISRTECSGRTIFLDGTPGDWLPEGFEVLAQSEGGLGDRLADAFSRVAGPAFLVGMDTPQISPELISESMERLQQPGTDAVIGLCPDGGYWGIGMNEGEPGAFDGVPMSAGDTGRRQIEQLEKLGMRVSELPMLRDVDYFSDARTVSAESPDGRFASTFASMELAL